MKTATNSIMNLVKGIMRKEKEEIARKAKEEFEKRQKNRVYGGIGQRSVLGAK